MQDLTVVHHTYDELLKNHQEYEDAADRFVTPPRIADGQQWGIYDNDLAELAKERAASHPIPTPLDYCGLYSRKCFPWHAALESHNQTVLNWIAGGDYSNVQHAIPFAQRLQAGLYAAFLTDVGLPPVHMSAVVAAL
jgi:hypothetical protein